MEKQTQQLVLMLVIGILIGTFVMLIFRGGASEDTDNALVQTEETIKTLTATGTESMGPLTGLLAIPEIPRNSRVGLSVHDQPSGVTVIVSGLSLSETKWVAVYDDRNGHPGWILGASRAHVGDTAIAVSLLRATLPGHKYYVAILNDDGDDAFNRLTDLPPFTPESITVVSFVAQ